MFGEDAIAWIGYNIALKTEPHIYDLINLYMFKRNDQDCAHHKSGANANICIELREYTTHTI